MSAAALVVLAALGVAPTPPTPTRWIEDHAELLTPGARAAIDAKLEAYDHQTGHQVVVWIGHTLDGSALDEWAVRTFAAWRVGRKGFDDGVAMFILADDRAIDIEVGYGLEDKLPDAIASRIIRDVMAPRMRSGDRDGAVTAGVDAVLAAIEGKPWTGTTTPVAARPPTWQLVGLGLIIALALLLFVTHPRLALWMFAMALGRSGSGGGGGFGGGGGRSGGGGSRGKW
jgi:uncharacterized protein